MNRLGAMRPKELKELLSADGEIALLDVREEGEFAAGHALFAVPCPLSRFEPSLLRLVPRRTTRLVLCDEGASGRAEWAARLAAAEGYSSVHVLDGGVEGWRQAGFGVFEGVNVPSKVLGEIVEHDEAVPGISASELSERLSSGVPVLVLDGRPFTEHRRMNIPGSICLPNGELALRIGALLDDETVPIVVHCAGRTRAIVGAQILREVGVMNPVTALEDGTQGWMLAGLTLEHGSERTAEGIPVDLEQASAQARRLAVAWSLPFVSRTSVETWSASPERTTYLLDVRGPAEVAARPVPGAIHAPGGQLVQAADAWLGTRNARLVLLDDAGIRSVVAARWLRRLGWEAYPFDVADGAWADLLASLKPVRAFDLENVPAVAARDLAPDQTIVDLRPSAAYRAGHVAGAVWATRATLPTISGQPALCGDAVAVGLVAKDLRAKGIEPSWLVGDEQTWAEAGLAVVHTPDEPPDDERIDFVAFAHGRHDGDLDAARTYLSWERGLLARLDPEERRAFNP